MVKGMNTARKYNGAERGGFWMGFSETDQNSTKRALQFVFRVLSVPAIPIVPPLSLVVPEKWSLFGH